MKDNELAIITNKLRDISRKHGASEQVRIPISVYIDSVFKNIGNNKIQDKKSKNRLKKVIMSLENILYDL